MTKIKRKHVVDAGPTTMSSRLKVIGVKKDDNKVTSARIVDSSKKISMALDQDNKSIKYSIQAPGQTGETGVLNACFILIQKLNGQGSNWDKPLDVSKHKKYIQQKIDCIAYDKVKRSESLKMQVTRSTHDKSFWKVLSFGTPFNQSILPSKAADNIYESIVRKSQNVPKAIRNELVLVLDATIAIHYYYADAVIEFQKKYGKKSKAFNYKAIWLVGLSPLLTWQLA